MIASDMKILLIGINSSFVHTNPAIRSMAACVGEKRTIMCAEYTINQDLHDILLDILEKKPDIAAFSCYIWNIEIVLKLACDLKKAAPKTHILLGGPEVSYDATWILEKHWFLDSIFCGEAEEAMKDILDTIALDSEKTVPGLLRKGRGRITGVAKLCAVPDLCILKPPFYLQDDIYDENRIYYYESARGCPFSCAYCLSGKGHEVREKPLGMVFEELGIYAKNSVRLVKFTDRTFNANSARAVKIWEYIIANTGDTCFHFEIAPDLLDEKQLGTLEKAPSGKIQLEAGIQTMNEASLEAVCRKMDIEKMKANVRAIMQMGNIHLHVDLIAGLPHENMTSFEQTFDQAFLLFADMLQLGFLKLLKGSKLREEAEVFGIYYRDYAPYEVIRTPEMSATELLMLKGVEQLLDRYYNRGRAKEALHFLMKENLVRPFAFFRGFYDFCVAGGYVQRPVSAQAQFELIISYCESFLGEDDMRQFLTHLKSDYINTKIKGRMPEKLQSIL